MQHLIIPPSFGYCTMIRPSSTCVVPRAICPGRLSPSYAASMDMPQRSEEWFAVRKEKLTTSTFSAALGFWRRNRRLELWQEKVFPSVSINPGAAALAAMEWGVLKEATAISQYRDITGREVEKLGFAVHLDEELQWLGASPDGILGSVPDGGILEVKCPFNKGNPEIAMPWSAVPYYYMPQVQGQMEIIDREWLDLYCWTPSGSTLFRIVRDRKYWGIMCGILKEFWWENVLPARKVIQFGRVTDAVFFQPAAIHKLTGYVVAESVKLAAGARLILKENGGI